MSNPEGLATGFTSGLYKFHWNTCIRLPLQSVGRISRAGREDPAGVWGMSVLAWALQQRAESSKDTLELELITFFEVSGWNPAPVSPEQTLHNLVLSLWGAAEHQHTKGLCLWRKKRTFLKQNHSVREGSSPTSATYLLKFALPGIRTL